MSEPEREDPPKLEYRKPIDELRVSQPEVVVGYAFATSAFIVAAIAVTCFAIFTRSYNGSQTSPADVRQADIMAGIAIGVGVASLIAMNWLALRLYRNPHRRAIALGIWIGQGVALLIEGACFASLR